MLERFRNWRRKRREVRERKWKRHLAMSQCAWMILIEIEISQKCYEAYDFVEMFRNVEVNPGLWIAINSHGMLAVVRHVAIQKIIDPILGMHTNPCAGDDIGLERRLRKVKRGDTEEAIRYLEEKLLLLPARLDLAYSWREDDVSRAKITAARWEAERTIRAAIADIRGVL